MGVAKLLWLFLGLGAVFIAYRCRIPPAEPPELDEHAWWSQGDPKIQDSEIHPFKIRFTPQMIEDVNKSLDRYLKKRPTPPLEHQGFQYGFNSDYLGQVVSYWRHKYQWRQRETYLNQFPQFKTWVNGLEMHFIRVGPKGGAGGKRVLPLLLMHGWPGSVREFYDVIPLLTTPRPDADFVFEVVAPSLPGYGFSQGSSKRGLGPAQMAVIMRNLMKKLKFEEFYVHGGDWGASVARNLAILYPKIVLGVHSSLCLSTTLAASVKWFLGSFFPPLVVDDDHRDLLYPLLSKVQLLLEEAGYAHLQATKPDTVGIALQDSPVGLAAYILEKFSTGTRISSRALPDGGLTEKISMDALLDNVVIYWVSASITTSMRIYAEFFSWDNLSLRMEELPVTVPTACAQFRHDALWQPRSFLSDVYPNLVRLSLYDGGHFPAMEVPATLGGDIWAAVRLMRHTAL